MTSFFPKNPRRPHASTSTTDSSTIMSDIKGIDISQSNFDGSGLRIGIVHARWNKGVIDALVQGTLARLHKSGVKHENIVIESVPGSFELPYACQA